MNDLFFFNPIHTSYSRHFAKMLDVMCDDSQAIELIDETIIFGFSSKRIKKPSHDLLTTA